jgi:hypothetical protein
MDSDQYEELCRRFIAEKANMCAEDVKSLLSKLAEIQFVPVD